MIDSPYADKTMCCATSKTRYKKCRDKERYHCSAGSKLANEGFVRMKKARLHPLRCALVLIAASGLAGSVAAQPYPSRPIRLILPFAAGGSIDVVARPIAQSLGDALGQQ